MCHTLLKRMRSLWATSGVQRVWSPGEEGPRALRLLASQRCLLHPPTFPSRHVPLLSLAPSPVIPYSHLRALALPGLPFSALFLTAQQAANPLTERLQVCRLCAPVPPSHAYAHCTPSRQHHQGRGLVSWLPCCLPSSWNSAQHVVGAQFTQRVG